MFHDEHTQKVEDLEEKRTALTQKGSKGPSRVKKVTFSPYNLSINFTIFDFLEQRTLPLC
jgi:hypothetical protein